MSVLRLFLCSLALVAPLFAKEEGWSGSHNVGITLAAGNSESLRATAGLEATGRFGEWEILGKASAIYGEDDGVRSNERADALLQVNRDLTRLLYAGLTTEFLYDPLAGIDARFGITPLLGMRHGAWLSCNVTPLLRLASRAEPHCCVTSHQDVTPYRQW